MPAPAIKHLQRTQNNLAVPRPSKSTLASPIDARRPKSTASVPTPLRHGQKSSQQNSHVRSQTPRPDVLAIQFHAALKRGIASRRHLPQPGDSGRHVEPSQVLNLICRKIVQRMRPGPHQTHVPFHHVPELRQFIQAVPPQKSPQPRDPRIIGDLEERPDLWLFSADCLSTHRHRSPWCETCSSGTAAPSALPAARCRESAPRIQLDHPAITAEQAADRTVNASPAPTTSTTRFRRSAAAGKRSACRQITGKSPTRSTSASRWLASKQLRNNLQIQAATAAPRAAPHGQARDHAALPESLHPQIPCAPAGPGRSPAR